MLKEKLKKDIENKIENTKKSIEICKNNSLNQEYFSGYLDALNNIYKLILTK